MLRIISLLLFLQHIFPSSFLLTVIEAVMFPKACHVPYWAGEPSTLNLSFPPRNPPTLPPASKKLWAQGLEFLCTYCFTVTCQALQPWGVGTMALGMLLD